MSDRLDLANYLPYLVNRLGSALVENFTASALAQYDLNIDAWRVMAVLANEGAQRQIDLAGMTSIEVSTLSRTVTSMERKRLLSRSRSDRDARAIRVELTESGRTVTERIIPLALDCEAAALDGLAPDEIEQLRGLLHRLYANMRGARAAQRRTALG
jgi:DNA-binding MarR family transcriptional regulator